MQMKTTTTAAAASGVAVRDGLKVTFCGAAGEVTGSSYLVETGTVRFLVDCGMFQGGREADTKNRAALDFDLESLAFVLITHAHIDHSGLLPRAVSLGFEGLVYATSASCDLLKVVLKDSAHIQERESEWENYSRHKARRHAYEHETAPLYTVTQAERALKRLRAVAYDEELRPHPAVRVRFRDAGHILGSAILEVWVTDSGGKTHKLVFSGDLGQPERPIVCDPTPITEADLLFVESTYGNRLHKGIDQTLDELVSAISHTLETKGGNVVIPAFAVGRTQDLLFLLYRLSREGRLSNLDIYVDSPMALAATEITFRHLEVLDAEAREMLRWSGSGEGKRAPRVTFTQEKEESMSINSIRGGAIIISSSGMCEAGRIKYHLRYNLPRPECSVLITGFQAAGTLGRRLVDGAETVRIFGDEVPVRADVYTVGGLSAHGDQRALLRWLGNFRRTPERTFIVHGEASIAAGFAALVRERLGWTAEVPAYGDSIQR